MAYESLKLFIDIVQARSFSRGAATNGVSQSAASQQVQDLERILGVELLDRSSRPLGVTPAGQLYAEFCRDVLHRKEEFDVTLERLKHEVEGTVRVAAIYSVGLSEMVELEAEFSHRQPDARLEVQYLRPEKIYAAVLGGDADLGLVSYPESSREITVIPWREEEMVLAASPQHPLARRPRRINPAELEGVDFVGFDEDLPIRRDIDRFLRDQGIAVNLTMHFDNLQMIKEAVAHNVGVSIMPVRIMREEIQQGRLVAIPDRCAGSYIAHWGLFIARRNVFIVWQAFLDLLREKPSPVLEPV